MSEGDNGKEPKLIYGVWIAGKGFLRGKDNEPIAFENLETACSCANLATVAEGLNVSGCAIVKPYDASMVDLEGLFLESEKQRGVMRNLETDLAAALANVARKDKTIDDLRSQIQVLEAESLVQFIRRKWHTLITSLNP